MWKTRAGKNDEIDETDGIELEDITQLANLTEAFLSSQLKRQVAAKSSLEALPQASSPQSSFLALALPPSAPLKNEANSAQSLIDYFFYRASFAPSLLEQKRIFSKELFQHFIRAKNTDSLQYRIEEANEFINRLLTTCDTLLNIARFKTSQVNLAHTYSVITALRFLESQYPELLPATKALKINNPKIEGSKHYTKVEPPVEVEGCAEVILTYIETFYSPDDSVSCTCIVDPNRDTKIYIDTDKSGQLLPDKKPTEFDRMFTYGITAVSVQDKKKYVGRVSDYFNLYNHDLTINGNKEKLTRELLGFLRSSLTNCYSYCRSPRVPGTEGGYTRSYSELLSFFRQYYVHSQEICRLIDDEVVAMAKKSKGYFNQFSSTAYLNKRDGLEVDGRNIGTVAAKVKITIVK